MEAPEETPAPEEAPAPEASESVELPAILFSKQMFLRFLALPTPEARSAYAEAVLAYGFSKKEPENLGTAEQAFFNDAKPFLDANRRKYIETKRQASEAGRAGKGVSRNFGNSNASKTYEERKLALEEKQLDLKKKQLHLQKQKYKAQKQEARERIAVNKRREAEANARAQEWKTREIEARERREQEARETPEAPEAREKTLEEIAQEQELRDRERDREEKKREEVKRHQQELAEQERKQKLAEAKEKEEFRETLKSYAKTLAEQFSKALGVKSGALNFEGRELEAILKESPQFSQELYKREALRRAREGEFIGSELTLRKLRKATPQRKRALAPLISQIMKEIHAHRWRP